MIEAHAVNGVSSSIHEAAIDERWECWYDMNEQLNHLRFGDVQYTLTAAETIAAMKAIAVGKGWDVNDIDGMHYPTAVFSAMVTFGRRKVNSYLTKHIKEFNEKHEASLPTEAP